MAEFIWATLIPQIHRQALAAKGVGSQFLTPRVRGRPLPLAQAAALLEPWSEWLGTGGVPSRRFAEGLDPGAVGNG